MADTKTFPLLKYPNNEWRNDPQSAGLYNGVVFKGYGAYGGAKYIAIQDITSKSFDVSPNIKKTTRLDGYVHRFTFDYNIATFTFTARLPSESLYLSQSQVIMSKYDDDLDVGRKVYVSSFDEVTNFLQNWSSTPGRYMHANLFAYLQVRTSDGFVEIRSLSTNPATTYSYGGSIPAGIPFELRGANVNTNTLPATKESYNTLNYRTMEFKVTGRINPIYDWWSPPPLQEDFS